MIPHEASQTTTVSLDPARANRALIELRDAVRRIGIAGDLFRAHLCACGRAGCPEADPASMSLLSMLRALATGWRSAPPTPEVQARLGAQLHAFADAFDLLACPCGEADCPTLSAERMETPALLRLVADQWHGRAGNRIDTVDTGHPDWEARVLRTLGWMAERFARNLGMLVELTRRLRPVPDQVLRGVLAAGRDRRDPDWLAEARAMISEAIATWLPHPGSLPEVAELGDTALALAAFEGWSVAEAAEFEGLAADGAMAILAFGIAHESVSRALFASFEVITKLTDLEAATEVLLKTHP